MRIIMLEVKKIVNRKSFWIVLCLLLASVFLDFFITCKLYLGQPLSTVPSAYYVMIINKYEGGTPSSLLFDSFLFFLVSAMIASDTLYDEKVLGINNYTFTRMDKGRYVFYKAISVTSVVFFTVFFAILLSQILTLCAFPAQGHLSGQITYNGLMAPDKERVFSYFESYYPYLNIFIFIILRGLIGAVAALLSFSLAFLEHAKRFTILLAPMVIYVIYSMTVALFASKIEDISTATIVGTNLLKVNTPGTLWVIVVFLSLELGASIFFIKRGLKNDEATL